MRPSAENGAVTSTTAVVVPAPADEQAVSALASLADLAKQTEALFARHASLRTTLENLEFSCRCVEETCCLFVEYI